MFCCRAIHSLQRQVLSLFYSKEPVVYQYTCDNTTVIEAVSLDRRITKYKLWEGEPDLVSHEEAETILFNRPEPPWLWVGASFFSDTIDATNELEPYIVDGNTITYELLNEKFPVYSDWKYLDAETLEEVDFPSEGITIHATRVETSEEEDEKVETS